MRLICLILLFALSFQTWGTDKYVCNSGAGIADGSTQENCYAGWTFADNVFSAGDTLYVCGTITLSSAANFTDSGTAGNPVIINGDCPGNPGVLDGNFVAAPVLQLGTSGKAASYVRVTNLTIKNSATNGDCILDSSLGAGGGFNEIIDNIITVCGGTSKLAIVSQKPGITIEGNDISYCRDDCVATSTAGTSPVIRGNTFSHFSYVNSTGDAIFINNGAVASNPIVEDNIIYWDEAAGVKQGMIVGISSGTLTVRNNKMIDRVGTVVNHAISIMAGTTVNVYGNYCEGWKACITHFSDSAEVLTALNVYGNISNGSQYLVQITTSDGTPAVNIDGNVGAGCGTRCIEAGGAGTALMVSNNILDAVSGAVSLYVSATVASYTGDNNDLYPEGAGFVQNYECGSTYTTLSAYKVGCGAVDQHSLSVDPEFVGGVTPNSPSGFRLKKTSPLIRAGLCTKSVGCIPLDFRGKRSNIPPDIGAFQRN